MPWTGLSDPLAPRQGAAHAAATTWKLWGAVFVLATLGAQWLSMASGGGGIFVRSAFEAGAWWQLLSAQWVHFGYLHALANAAAMVVVLHILHAWVSGTRQALALLGGYGGVAAVLACDPNCAVYAGASGALHGLLAGSALSLLLLRKPAEPTQHRRSQWLALALLLGLGAKLLIQHVPGSPHALGWLGVASYYPAHEAGALGGLVATLLAHRWLPQRVASPGTEQ